MRTLHVAYQAQQMRTLEMCGIQLKQIHTETRSLRQLPALSCRHGCTKQSLACIHCIRTS